jgi:hypothetical protein
MKVDHSERLIWPKLAPNSKNENKPADQPPLKGEERDNSLQI